jgi:tripartite-type tricarboxylate transporter receptor subunit TctC
VKIQRIQAFALNVPIRKFFVSTALATTVCITSGAVNAQAWPSKPVYMMVPASAGGSLDTLARPLAAKLSQPGGNSSAEFGEFVKTELTRWGTATKSAGLKPE